MSTTGRVRLVPCPGWAGVNAVYVADGGSHGDQDVSRDGVQPQRTSLVASESQNIGTRNTETSLCVYFFGDDVGSVSTEYNLDARSVATHLFAAFPGTHTLVMVVPSRYEAGWACYDNFLEHDASTWDLSGFHGRGKYTCRVGKACRQLFSILEHLDLLGGIGSWSLLGFSKGGLVLNQILTEIGDEGFVEDMGDVMKKFYLDSLEAVHFLDVGNPLNSGVYITPSDSLRGRYEIVIHLTERQCLQMESNKGILDELINLATWDPGSVVIVVYDPRVSRDGPRRAEMRAMPPPPTFETPRCLAEKVVRALSGPDTRDAVLVDVVDEELERPQGLSTSDWNSRALFLSHCRVHEYIGLYTRL
jgi:hypothetical protein